MSVGKTNPLRQQMINMMYLVLTALLALNVSAEILKAFATVNLGMKNAISLIDDKNEFSMKEFKKLVDKSPGNKEFFEKAQECNKISNDFYDYIEKLKAQLIELSGGYVDPQSPDIEKRMAIKRESDLNVPANIMIREKKGDEVYKKIQETRKKYLELFQKVPGVTEKQIATSVTLDAKNPTSGNKTWAEASFHMVPTIAAVTLLTKIQNDIRNTQANLIDALINSIGKMDISFDQLTPVYQTEKASIAVGEKFSASVFLAAYDSKQQPEIYIGGRPYEVKDGVAKYEVVEGSQGSREVPIVIKQVNRKTGEVKEYKSTMKYDVFQAPATISATKMNVVYIGLANPISISVPGFRPSDVVGSITGGGTLTPDKSPGDFLCNVPDNPNLRSINIKAFVKLPGGGTKEAGSKEFRIRSVPRPTPFFGSKSQGEISIGELRTVDFVRIVLLDFAFEGINYQVTKFVLVYAPQRGQVRVERGTGARLTPAMKQMLSNPAPGDQIIVTEMYGRAYGSSVTQANEKRVPDLVLKIR